MSDTHVPSLQGAALRGVILPCGCGCQSAIAAEPVIVTEVMAGASGSARGADAPRQPPRSDATNGAGAQAHPLPSLVPI